MDGRILKNDEFKLEGINSFFINNNLIGYAYFKGKVLFKFINSHNMLYIKCNYEYFSVLNNEIFENINFEGNTKGYCFIK